MQTTIEGAGSQTTGGPSAPPNALNGSPPASPQPTAAPDPAAPPAPEGGDKSAPAPSARPAASAEPPAAQSDDWRAALAGEDTALLELLSRYKSANDAGKAFLEQRRELSKRAALAPLAADATAEQIAEHRKALGIPEVVGDAKPEAYMEAMKIQLPADYELSEMAKGAIGDYAKHAYAIGADPRLTQQSVDFYLKAETANQQAMQQAIVDKRAEWQGGLQKELGADYETTIAAAKQQLRQMAGDDDTLTSIVSAQLPGGGLLGDHPLFIKAMADLAMQNGFSDRIEANAYEAGGKSLAQQQTELEALRITNPALYNAQETQKKLEKVIGLRLTRGELDEMGNERKRR